ncbi:hypothetical protein EON65_40705, partial [archaeon]
MAEEKKMDVEEEKSSGASGSQVRFEIKKWNAVTMWSWDICADTCAICRNSLNEPSIEYQVMYYHVDYMCSMFKCSFLKKKKKKRP